MTAPVSTDPADYFHPHETNNWHPDCRACALVSPDNFLPEQKKPAGELVELGPDFYGDPIRGTPQPKL